MDDKSTRDMSMPEAWGRIYAIIDALTTGGLKASEINQAVLTPGKYFGGLHQRVVRRMPSWALARLTALSAGIDPADMDMTLNLGQQGEMMLGYYHERSRMADLAKAAGRPQKGSADAIDWDGVDWGLGNSELARELGVARQTVAAQRKRHGPREL